MSIAKQESITFTIGRASNGYVVREGNAARCEERIHVAEGNESLHELIETLMDKVMV